MSSVLDYKFNLERIETFIEKGKKNEVKHFFLPEVFFSISDGTSPTPYLVKEGNEYWDCISSLAKKHSVYLLGGSVAYQGDEQVLNRNINFDSQGKLIGFYDKRKLFACDLSRHDSKQVINEADVYSSGSKSHCYEVGGFRIGATICFDLRFPELFRSYRKENVDVITVSSAFTRATGRAHWETLLRARAIENQCYIIAANQWGEHNEKMKTWGHSMVIDPWGDILCDAKEGEKIVYADLSKKRITDIRQRMTII